MIASVIVNVSNSNVDRQFDYLVPDTMQDIIKVGARVKVAFGDANRTIMGYVYSLKNESDFSGKLKEIVELLDIEPLISESQFKLAQYIKYDSLSPLVRILNMMIPNALRLKTIKYLHVKNINELDADLALLFNGRNVIEYSNSLLQYNYKIQKEIKKGNIEISYDALTRTKEKVVNKYQVNMEAYFTINFRVSEYIKDVLRMMIEDEPLTPNEIVDKYEISLYMVNSLIKKGIFTKFVRNFLELGGKRSYIKRVIALPGEKIDIKDGKIYKIEKGIYSDVPSVHYLAVIMKKYPYGVFTSYSAYYYHNLTDVIPNHEGIRKAS